MTGKKAERSSAIIDAIKNGALFTIAGTGPESPGDPWLEDFSFSKDGKALDLSGSEFVMTFRRAVENAEPEFSFSAEDGTLAVVADKTGLKSILRIDVPSERLVSVNGAYFCELSIASAAGLQLLAHGAVAFAQSRTTEHAA